MTTSTPGRPRDFSRWLVVFLLIAAIACFFWYRQQRQQLICSDDAQASWSLTYADGEGISKFMWNIHPKDAAGFVDCLKTNGYDVKTVQASGEITAFDGNGRTISNTVGDDFVQNNTFYKW
jgi:hypothetical protein